MSVNLKDQLRKGKKIKVKHPEYAFTIHAELKLEDDKTEPTIKFQKVNLPQTAKRGEKYLLKLVHIYCFDVMCNNLMDTVLNSREYQKIIGGLRNANPTVSSRNLV